MLIKLASPLQIDSIVDGEGIRTVIWTQGCVHNCLGCHNPNTHSFKEGDLILVEDIKKEILSLKLQDGITFSGGDPMCQPIPCLEIAKFCQKNNLNVWCYTGYTFEELLNFNNPVILEFLENIDVLIDGKFKLEERSLNLKFRGSHNQRIIDVKESLERKEIILVKHLMKNDDDMIKREVYI